MAEEEQERKDPMAGIEVPLAVRPNAPKAPNVGPQGAQDFKEHVESLEELKETGKSLHEMASTGQRLTQAANAKLHGADLEGARADLEAVARLPTPREVIGEKLWGDRLIRLRLCTGNHVSWFIQGHLASLSFLSFLERGALTPDVPERCRIGVHDFDDERYILGMLDAVRELERYGANRGQALDLDSLRLCLSASQCLEQALMQFDFRNSDLRRKFDGIKYQVRKFETFVYEVDLAIKRRIAMKEASEAQAASASAAASEAASAGDSDAKEGADVTSGGDADTGGPAALQQAEAGAPPVLDLRALGEIKKRYDHFDACRELVMKRGRDVVKNAKNAIYALHRSDFKKADADLKQCAKDSNGLYTDVVAAEPSLRGSIFSGGLEEMCEALAYRVFQRERRILSKTELDKASGLNFEVGLHEYLGGLFDLTGEIGRFAVRSCAKGRQALPEVELCRACVVTVQGWTQELPYLPMGLGKKTGVLRSTLQKIENALYELALLSQAGLRVQAPALRAGDEADGDDAGAEEGPDGGWE